MAMIQCPNCGADVSDKAKTCIKCGYVLIEESKHFCGECGAEISAADSVCGNCGCPVPVDKDINAVQAPQQVEVTKIKTQISKKTIIAIIAAVIVIIGGIVGVKAILANKAKKEAAQASADYGNSVSFAASLMLSGATQAEYCGGLIHDVWYNTIYEKRDSSTDAYTLRGSYFSSFNSDFNVSLNNLFADEEFSGKIDSIKDNQNKVAEQLKYMTNPPDDWKDAYNILLSLYDAYLDITNCATDPSGNLTLYTATFNEADSSFVSAYNKMEMYIG